MNNSAAPVLIVEDSDEDFEITVGALRQANMRSSIVRCISGTDVRNFLHRQEPFASVVRPSLILLDLNIIGADGRKLLKEFRRVEWLRSVPISILSTSSNPADIEYCYSASANSYLVKPVDLDRFEALVVNFITYWFDTVVLPNPAEELQYVTFSG